MSEAQDRRIDKRDLFTATIEYSLPAQEGADENCTIGLAMSNNISAKGISLYLAHGVDTGSCITLYSRHLSDNLVSGRVAWCNRVADHFYRIGIRLN